LPICNSSPGFSFPSGHPRPVDLHPVRAAEVADHEVVVDLRQHAVAAGHLLRVQLHVALLVPAEQQHRLVEQDARAVGE
jgi:hypothetical protein